MKEYKGILRMKLERVGSRSEGPEYSLQLKEPNDFNQSELSIGKKAKTWEEDPNLHKYIGKTVFIMGEPIYVKHVKFDGTIKTESIDYKFIELFEE